MERCEMQKIKVIQIGVGGFGQSWLTILRDLEDIELVAVVDVVDKNLEDARKILMENQVSYYHNYIEAFENEKADAVVIVTPPQTHKSIALSALEAGLYVFMEKPITQDFQEALELYQESKKFNKFVMISQNYRWRPEIEAVRQCVESGKIGAVEYGEWNFRRATVFGGWRDKYKEILIEDMSIHHFDLLRHILGKDATSIYASSLKPTWSWFEGKAVVSATIKFEDEILINYFGSWVTRGKETSWNGEFRLVGSKGVIELIDDVPYVTDETGNVKVLPVPEMKYTDRTYSIYEMVRAINEKRLPITHLEDNLKSFSIVGGALNSVKKGQAVDIAVKFENALN
jgi:predicted dehydrogenase